MGYTAAKSRTQDRPGFSISFRHPLRLDKKGRPGLKVRRGLNTDDPTHADQLVEQMNKLLADKTWWNADRLDDARARFDPVIVDAFYYDIQAGQADSEAIRNTLLPMPTRNDGYARALFVGTTGAGKTSLLRHFIGSDPDDDRFPSTSTAKTTVSDIEVIPGEGPYRAVVTFFSEFVVQASVEDCLLNACTAVWEKQSDEKIVERFLNHPDQRFRLSYTLGAWRTGATDDDANDWSFEEGTDQLPIVEPEESVGAETSGRNRVVLEGYLKRIKAIADPLIAQAVADFGEIASLAADDVSAALEIFQEQAEETAEFTELAHDVMAELAERFKHLTQGELHLPRKTSPWPSYWTFETSEREEFIRHIRRFSSNFAPSFGRLLTPLVDGIRIMGPLFPAFTKMRPKMVLIDGQGLGHTAESSASVTTHITRKFAEVDVILLVDNAEQPIQAAAQAVLRAAASSGHYGKVAIAFTHFDQVKGPNLPTVADKRAHVVDSLDGYLASLKDVLSGAVVGAMSRSLQSQCFMLGGLHSSSRKLPRGVVSELERLMTFFESSVKRPPAPETHPRYDPSGIGFAVQKATENFQRLWAARLKLTSDARIEPAHWTRVKALARRIGGEMDVEYDVLKPVAELVARTSEEISNFLDNPIEWTRPPASEQEAQEAISAIRRDVFTELHDVMLRRLVKQYLGDWRDARDRSGKGSAYRRALDLKAIYEAAAPVPGTVNSEAALSFLSEVRNIVCRAIQANGGELRIALVA